MRVKLVLISFLQKKALQSFPDFYFRLKILYIFV